MSTVAVDTPRAVEIMGDNLNAENTSPGLKRKTTDDPCSPDIKGKAKQEPEEGPEKRLRSEAPPLIELKGRKLVFGQRPEKPPPQLRRRLLAWQQYRLEAEDEGRTIEAVPEQFWDVLVLSGHESLARTEALFVKQLKMALADKVDENWESLTATSIASIVPKLFAIRDYGFVISDFPPSSTVKIPAILQIRCWEALEPEKYFTDEQNTVLAGRRAERSGARAECLRLLENMDDIEKLELLRGEKGEKGEKSEKSQKGEKGEKGEKGDKGDRKDKMQDKVEVPRPAETSERKSRENTATTSCSRRSASPVKHSKMTAEEEEEARLKKEEREARKAVKEEQKIAREREEEKKQAVADKQRQTMNAFFKPKSAAAIRPIASSSKATSSPIAPSVSTCGQIKTARPITSDFVRTFKPVVVRPNVEWAPINRWRKPQRRSPVEGISVSSRGQAFQDPDVVGESSAQAWTSQELLRDHVQRYHQNQQRSRPRLPRGLKTAPPYGTVQDIWIAYQDAADPRKVLDQLRNRERYPWKILAFEQQPRPPYCGTFTKKSVSVGPRTWYKQDPTIDYSHDSGDEWQDDEGGEDVDDFGEGAQPEDDEMEEDESEGEFDDWLDDTEDAVYVPTEADDDDGSHAPVLEQSRLPLKVVSKTRDLPKKTAKVVRVVPTWKGPMWESKIGHGVEGFVEYRLEVLNDAPDSIDPFSYVSAEEFQQFKPVFTSISIGMNNSVRCLLSAEPVSAQAAAIAATIDATVPHSVPETGPTVNGSATSRQPKKNRPAGPKIVFPLAHLAELLQAIDGNTRIRSDLVSFLKAQFDNRSTKAAISDKLSEVATRQGKAKDSAWKVKPEAWAAAGLPARSG